MRLAAPESAIPMSVRNSFASSCESSESSSSIWAERTTASAPWVSAAYLRTLATISWLSGSVSASASWSSETLQAKMDFLDESRKKSLRRMRSSSDISRVSAGLPSLR